MHKENIYVGQIKKCLNYFGYFDENSYFKEMAIVISNYALLIKKDDDTFIWLNSRTGNKRILKTVPTEDEMLFVNKESILNYYDKKGFVSKRKLMLEYACDFKNPYIT